MDEQTLRDNITKVQERIAIAEHRAGRPGQVTLIAVSKTHPPDTIVAAYRAGLSLFGENRVEEAGPKAAVIAMYLQAEHGDERLRRPIEWHMIGHLQSRKAADVLPWASMVHSVDTVKLAARLSRAAPAGGLLPILLEANVSGEESKAGFAAADLPAAVEAIAPLPGLRIEGLMTMAPVVEDPELTRPVFCGLRGLRDRLAEQYPGLPWTHLSMGMTADFEVAIEEGATLVRIGRAIFGD
jgi:pyridoxal phosphate enzyme (YggS family)